MPAIRDQEDFHQSVQAPVGNGQVENFQKTLHNGLSYLDSRGKNWDENVDYNGPTDHKPKAF